MRKVLFLFLFLMLLLLLIIDMNFIQLSWFEFWIFRLDQKVFRFCKEVFIEGNLNSICGARETLSWIMHIELRLAKLNKLQIEQDLYSWCYVERSQENVESFPRTQSCFRLYWIAYRIGGELRKIRCNKILFHRQPFISSPHSSAVQC